ncbi:MAG: helix-turn-helix transcriptional regulator [Ruminococcaceae bacterium]|nr:helix-turn-helix transcriptional regulator [Oscillospiraceae bacterium]
MIDKRVGKRIKQRREELGLTQEQLAERLGVATNYISTIERGASFPRYEKLVMILNALHTSADSIFCDVLDYGGDFKTSVLSEQLKGLPPDEQKRILGVFEFMIEQAKEINKK